MPLCIQKHVSILFSNGKLPHSKAKAVPLPHYSIYHAGRWPHHAYSRHPRQGGNTWRDPTMVVKDSQWDVLSWTLWIQRYRDQPDMLRLHHFSLLLHQTILLWQSNECFPGEDWRWLNFHDIIMHSWGRSHHNDNCCSSDMVPTEEKSCILIITSEYHGVSTAGIRRWPDRLWPGLRFFLELSGVYSVFAGRRLHHTITWYKP